MSGLVVDWNVALEQLRSHDLSALFTQSLGWDAPQLEPVRYLKRTCTPIAERAQVIVWQVRLTPKSPFSTDVRCQIYDVIAQNCGANPLVVFVDAQWKRSLWCQSASESAVYVAGQPSMLWRHRLERFAQADVSTVRNGLFPGLRHSKEQTGKQRIEPLVQALVEGTTGIESISECRSYAALTIQRLIFIQQLQQRGFMNGDTWYLQTYFGQALQEGDNLFYRKYLRSLYQHLSLPDIERPTALKERIGTVPFLGALFDTHWIEEKYETIEIVDSAFEDLLGWLSEQGTVGTLDPWVSADLSDWLSRYWRWEKRGVVQGSTPEMARVACAQTLDMWLLNKLDGSAEQTLNDVLFDADTLVCRRLIQEVLPDIKVLDPDCGGGALLVAFYQRLVDIFSVLTGHIQQSRDAQLKIWQSGLMSNDLADRADQDLALLLTIQQRILRNNLYGVAASVQEMEAAHLLLLMHLCATAQFVEQIEPLVDLGFTIMHGNALIGFITVDEERFDRVNRAGVGSVLQGNLLQPLAADGYQTILSERNVALEHYQARTEVLADSHSVPFYARADLLRSQIAELDEKAQRKLDALLLNEMGQQLGIRYRVSSVTRKPQRRLLEMADVVGLDAFHWGYRFGRVMREGGFDVVACWPVSGVFRATVGEFERRVPEFFQDGRVFKTSKAALAGVEPEVARRWLGYQDGYVVAGDYFYRGGGYRYQVIGEGRRQLAWERLFVERCFGLLGKEGVGGVVMLREALADERMRPLLEFVGGREFYVCDSDNYILAFGKGAVGG